LSKLQLLLSSRDRELSRISRSLNHIINISNPTHNIALINDIAEVLKPNNVDAALDNNFETYNALRDFSKLLINSCSASKRSAYETMRTDIGSIRRLRVTKGICLPSDYPLHLVCGSKDVIHS